jgi:hypothetical protein
MKIHYQADPQSELHLPDEARSFTLAPSIPGCACGHQAALERRIVDPEIKLGASFRVICSVVSTGMLTERDRSLYSYWVHTEPTPWLSSSKEAVQH